MILAYDIGTTYLKGALIDGGGRVAAAARVPIHALDRPQLLASEVDPDTWLSGIALVTAQLGMRDRGLIAGVVVSSNGPTLAAVDPDGEPLGSALTWMDRRSEVEAREIAEYASTPVDASFFLPKALWIMRHRPDDYRHARWLLPCAEFVDLVLTGSAHRVIPTPLFADYFWNEPAIVRVGLDPGRFPPFVELGEQVGVVRQAAADTLGLPAGVPVLAGGADFLMSILGTAATQPGRTCDRAGTSEGINLCWPRPVQDRRLRCFPHVVRGAFNVAAILASSGSALAWAARSLAGYSGDVEALLDDAARAPAGAEGLLFLPFLDPACSPLWYPAARGAFAGLSQRHTPRDLARAVVESTGFAVRTTIDAMAEHGCQVTDLRVTGGLAHSPAWCQIRADVTGRRVLVPEQEEADLVGNACVGFTGLGKYDSLAEASESLVRFRPATLPSTTSRALYEERYQAFRSACASASRREG